MLEAALPRELGDANSGKIPTNSKAPMSNPRPAGPLSLMA